MHCHRCGEFIVGMKSKRYCSKKCRITYKAAKQKRMKEVENERVNSLSPEEFIKEALNAPETQVPIKNKWGEIVPAVPSSRTTSRQLEVDELRKLADMMAPGEIRKIALQDFFTSINDFTYIHSRYAETAALPVKIHRRGVWVYVEKEVTHD